MPQRSARRLSILNRTQLIELEIGRFAGDARPRLRTLASLSQRFADLLWSYPAAAFALAAGRIADKARGEAFAIVKAGRPLEALSRALRFPDWYRRLPPEAFSGAGLVAPFEASEEFDRQIRHHIPRRIDWAASWLAWVRAGLGKCDETFALWLAAQRIYGSPFIGRRSPELLAAYAWLSCNQQKEIARLGVRPWQPAMSFVSAAEAARHLAITIRLETALGGTRLPGAWVSAGSACGLDFVPLATVADLCAEATGMRSCVAEYALPIAQGHCRLFSVREGGSRIATLEIRPGRQNGGVPEITTLLGFRNAPVGADVWRAARLWLATRARLDPPAVRMAVRSVHSIQSWSAVVGSWIAAKGPTLLFPHVPSEPVLERLGKEAEGLRLIAGESGDEWMIE